MSPTWECGLWPGCRGWGSAEALLACTSEAVVTQHHGQRHGHVGGAVPAASTMASACLLLRGWGGPVALSCPQAPPPESEGPTSGASG